MTVRLIIVSSALALLCLGSVANSGETKASGKQERGTLVTTDSGL